MMRFGTGPQSFVWPVRWFFTSRDFNPIPNVYWSHNWTEQQSRPWWDTGEVGEVYGEQRLWVNGAPPPPAPGNGPHGDQAAWDGGLAGPRFDECGIYPPDDTGAYDRSYSWAYDSPA